MNEVWYFKKKNDYINMRKGIEWWILVSYEVWVRGTEWWDIISHEVWVEGKVENGETQYLRRKTKVYLSFSLN